MAAPTPAASATPATPEDLWKRDIVRDLLLNSNGVAMDYAKLMVSLNGIAIGVVTTLAELGDYGTPSAIALICFGYIICAGLFVSVVFPRNSRLTVNDFLEAPELLAELAARRRRWSVVASIATAMTTVVAVSFSAWGA